MALFESWIMGLDSGKYKSFQCFKDRKLLNEASKHGMFLLKVKQGFTLDHLIFCFQTSLHRYRDELMIQPGKTLEI